MSMLLFEDNKFIGGKYSFNSPFTSLPPALSGFTFTRASNATAFQNGQLVTLAPNQFGTSRDPVTGMYGYLSETAATNLSLYSEDLSVWGKTRCTVTTNTTTAPDGTPTADKIIGTAIAGTHKVFGPDVVKAASAVTYTGSVYVKAGEYNFAAIGLVDNIESGVSSVGINLTTGEMTPIAAVNGFVAGAAIVENIGSGWWRVSLTCTSNTDTIIKMRVVSSLTLAANGDGAAGDGVSGIYAWGAQLETGVYASSYIPTAGATATRAATVLSAPYSSIQGNNLTAYTLYADYRDTNSAGTRRVVLLSDGSSNNGAYIINDTTKALLAIGGGVIQSNQTSANTTTRTKAALSLQNNSAKGAFNGVGVVEDTVVTMPAALTAVHLGVNWNSINQLNGYLFEARYYPTALTQAQINGLTL